MKYRVSLIAKIKQKITFDMPWKDGPRRPPTMREIQDFYLTGQVEDARVENLNSQYNVMHLARK